MAERLWFAMYITGAGLLIGALLSPWMRRNPRKSMLQLIEQFRRAERRMTDLVFPDMPPQEIAFVERARLAGVAWSYRKFKTVQWCVSLAGVGLVSIYYGFRAGTLPEMLWPLAIAFSVGILLYWLPYGLMTVFAARRKMLMLIEISKFAHRLSICVSDKADVREMIARAGRPLKVLRPHLHRLSAQWGNNQREAILAFKDGVGISEVYPLVNAFAAISRAKPEDVSRLLVEHSRSIDASLASELEKRIENAPIWISFYIMAPFMVCLLLFVYPWVLTVLQQLAHGF